MKMRALFLAVLPLLLASCVEKWNVDMQGEMIDGELSVVAAAVADGGRMTFTAVVEPMRSSLLESQDYPLDGLRLDVVVDGEAYSTDTLASYVTAGARNAFLIDWITVQSECPKVEFTITDERGNYGTVSGTATAAEKPQMDVEVSPVKFSGADKSWEDSAYVASVTIHDPSGVGDYYLLAVQFYAYNGLNISVRSADNDFGEFSSVWWQSVGYAPFSGADAAFFDEKITASLSGFPLAFSNIFSDETFDGESHSFTIAFENAMDSCFPVRPSNFPRTNALTPFKIHLCKLTEDDYEYYKKMQYYLCSEYGIFSEPTSLSSNLTGGYGYFALMNMQEFLYFDNEIHN